MAEKLVRIEVRQSSEQRDVIQFPDFTDGSRCGLRFRYSAYTSSWYVWFLDLDSTPIWGPIALVPGLDLFEIARFDPRIPRGALFVYADDHLPPNATTIDTTARVYYRPVVA